MYLVLLTGGLASGKGTVRTHLEKLGARTLDLDAVARQEQEDSDVLEQLEAAFGPGIVDGYGKLNRRLLADRAFVSAQDTERLNAICWPPVVKRVEAFLAEEQRRHAAGAGGPVVLEVPLLVESGVEFEQADEVLTVAAPEQLRLARACARGMREADARRRIEQQASDEERAAISDTVFDNSGDLEALYAQVLAWYEKRRSEGFF
ncbi:MAG: dephospho-CoA kinase [Coriobacteriales bacterium]|jgi:dephospho-CoA kinase|nr:dephospho-CoA kinase [Coriobacteriales bacterium]